MTDYLSERILTLERRLAGLQADVDAANARNAMAAGPYQMRIGRITGSPQEGDNTFSVIFEDGTFDEAQGEQSPEYTSRQSVARTVVHNLADEKIPNNTRVPCWYWSDRWWTWYKTAETDETGEMACVMICFWIEECCIYRGLISNMSATSDYCHLSCDLDPIFIVHCPVIDEELDPDDPLYGKPLEVLVANAVGWARKIDDEFECTYKIPDSGGIEITESLAVYQWCLIQPRECPLKEQVVHVDIQSSKCETIDDIGVDLYFVEGENIPCLPENLPDCCPDEELGIYDNGAWIGEFSVSTQQPIRLFGVTYLLTGTGPPEELEIGWMQLDWCTGALVQLYRNDNGDPVVEDRAWHGLEYDGSCTPLLDGIGNVMTESVTYSYRLLFACDMSTGIKTVCLEHIYPACHPWAGEALQDAGRGDNFIRICANSHMIEMDIEWGTSPTKDDGVGYFGAGDLLDNGPSQFAIHRFGGCANDIGTNCALTEDNQTFRMIFTW